MNTSKSTAASESGHAGPVGAERVIAVLVELANRPHGVSLDELSKSLSSTKPTVHRALSSLRKAGLAQLSSRGVYMLGDEFLRLAFRNLEGRPELQRLQPLLQELAEGFGETVHYATLEGTSIVYRAKVDPPDGAVRLTSTVGGRNPAYRTAVGKVLLAEKFDTAIALLEWMGTEPLERATPNTRATAAELWPDLVVTRKRGYGIDAEENEIGINCLAVPIYLDGSIAATGALSISAVQFRCPIDTLVPSVPVIRETIVRHLGAAALGQGSFA